MNKPVQLRAENVKATSEKPGDQFGEERSYAAICAGMDLAFDPMKDLNLPASYEEVVSRFRRLQGVRAQEALN